MTLGTLGTVLGVIALVLVVFAVLLLIFGIFEGHQNPPHLKGKPVPIRPGRLVLDCSRIDREALAADTAAKLNFDYGIEKSTGWPIISFIPLFPRTTEPLPEKTPGARAHDALLIEQSITIWATTDSSVSETFGRCAHCGESLKLSYAAYAAKCYGDSQAGMVRLFRRYSCPNGPHLRVGASGEPVGRYTKGKRLAARR